MDNIWLQWNEQRQLQDQMRNISILGFDVRFDGMLSIWYMKIRTKYIWSHPPTFHIPSLIHCGLMMPYDAINLGQHWLTWCLLPGGSEENRIQNIIKFAHIWIMQLNLVSYIWIWKGIDGSDHGFKLWGISLTIKTRELNDWNVKRPILVKYSYTIM